MIAHAGINRTLTPASAVSTLNFELLKNSSNPPKKPPAWGGRDGKRARISYF